MSEIPFDVNWLYAFTAPIGLSMLGVIMWKSQQAKPEKHVPDLLWKMHNRMIDFVDVRTNQDMDESKVRRAMTLSADRTGMVKLKDKDNVTKDLKKQLGLGTRLPKSGKRVEELSLKMASIVQEFTMPEKQWELKDQIIIGESLDGEKIGLGGLRDTNRKWQRWHKKLTSIQQRYADEQLDKLISASIFISYGCCSQLLYVAYLFGYESNEIFADVISLVRGVTANMKVQIDDAIRDSIRPITNRIQELHNQEDSK